MHHFRRVQLNYCRGSIDSNRASLVGRGIEIVDVSYSPAHATAQSMYADFYTETRTGRIILWSSGLCDIEVLEIGSTDQLFWKHYDIIAPSDFGEAINTFLEALTADR